jgi:hypothetical protein
MITPATTWPCLEEMRRGIVLMQQGIPYFAWQYVHNGEQAYKPCRHLNQLTQFEADIFEGSKTVGFYTIRPDNLTRWGGLDFDDHDGRHPRGYWQADARRAFDRLAAKLAERWLVESSPGGFHVIGFADALEPAADMRRTFLEIAPAGVEVFPKQDALDATKPNAKGSLLRFPGKHQLKGTWARFIARHGHVQDMDVTPAPKQANWTEPTPEGRLRSLYVIATRGIEINEAAQFKRFKAMQKIAGRLKGRASESEALWVYTAWHNHNADKIGTPLQESRKAFLACYHAYAPCIVEIPDYPPTELQQEMIAALPPVPDVSRDRLAATVCLFLSAKRYADSKGLPTFWLGYRTIGQRLGVGITAAAKYAFACRKLRIVDVVERGHTGTATTYRLGKDWER